MRLTAFQGAAVMAMSCRLVKACERCGGWRGRASHVVRCVYAGFAVFAGALAFGAGPSAAQTGAGPNDPPVRAAPNPSAAASGAQLRIVTWNILRGSPEQVEARGADDFVPAGRLLAGDVIAVQEVTSFPAVVRLAQFLGFSSPHIAVSNARRDTQVWYEALELGVISRVPIVSAQTMKPRPDKFGAITIDPDGKVAYFGQERSAPLTPPARYFSGQPQPDLAGERGVLRVELANGLVLYNVHLKSGYPEYCARMDERLGKARALRRSITQAGRRPTPLEQIDLSAADEIMRNRTALRSSANPTASQFHFDYARLREGVMAAVAQRAARDEAAGLTPVVLGDFNISAEEPCKSGLDPMQDAAPVMDCDTKIVPRTCGRADGYDDTHAFLTQGIVGNLRMVPLSQGIGRTQWSRNWRAFPDVPIDHIYVPRRARRQFTLVEKIVDPRRPAPGSKVFGSDHAPLVTVWTPPQ